MLLRPRGAMLYRDRVCGCGRVPTALRTRNVSGRAGNLDVHPSTLLRLMRCRMDHWLGVHALEKSEEVRSRMQVNSWR